MIKPVSVQWVWMKGAQMERLLRRADAAGGTQFLEKVALALVGKSRAATNLIVI